MRIKKGSRVEVWSTEEAPMGAWRAGEVLWGNGHAYIVRYDHSLPGVDPVSQRRILRKSVRPCPPDAAVSKNWGVGDMAEVFDDYSWKCAEIMRVDDRGRFDVKIIGSSKVVRACSGSLRVQQTLKDDDEWVVIEKANERSSLQVPQSCIDVGKHGEDDGGRAGGGEDAGFGAIALKSAKKKRSHCLMDVEGVQSVGGKRIRVEEERRYESRIEGWSSELPEKIDGYAHAARSPDMGLDKQKAITGDGYEVVGTEEDDDDDTETVSSSIGSSSNPPISAPRDPQDPNASQLQNSDSHSDDRTESCSRVREPLIDGKEISDEQIHHLELRAYNSTMAAFFASGPLSWEQEELLTNLRLMLHISSEEHLQAEIGGLLKLATSPRG